MSENTPPPTGGARVAAVAVVVAVLAAIAVVLLPPLRPTATAPAATVVGAGAPDFTARDLRGGGPLRLADYRGRPVVVNFWASWCAPCRDEAAALAEAERRWRDRGVVFLGVSVRDHDPAARAFLDRYRVDYRSGVDSTGTVAGSWGVTGLPETFFVDASGRVRARVISAIDPAELERQLAALTGG